MGILLSMRKKKSSKANISSNTKKKKNLSQSSILKYFNKEKENKPAISNDIPSRHAGADIVEIKEDDSQENITNYNVLFYQNELKSEPHGDYIEEILQNWHGNYILLEKHHGYIQWLFPTKECGRNQHAQPLNKEEIVVISNSDALKNRLLRAYKMMLDFYGFTMVNDQTGEVAPNKLHSKRVSHLKRSRHNHLRITRILSSLNLLGLESITYPFLRELIHLTFGKDAPLCRCRHSCLHFWLPTVSKSRERHKFEKMVISLKEEAIEST